jgi:hypothetical protein
MCRRKAYKDKPYVPVSLDVMSPLPEIPGSEPPLWILVFEIFLVVIYAILTFVFIGLSTSEPGSIKFVPIFDGHLNWDPMFGTYFNVVPHLTNVYVVWFGVAIFALSCLTSLLNIFYWQYKFIITFTIRAVVQATAYVVISMGTGALTVQVLCLAAVLAFAKVFSVDRTWRGFALSFITGNGLWGVLISQFAANNSQQTFESIGQAALWLCFVFWILFLVAQIVDLTVHPPGDIVFVVYELIFGIVIILVAFLAYVKLGWHASNVALSTCYVSGSP